MPRKNDKHTIPGGLQQHAMARSHNLSQHLACCWHPVPVHTEPSSQALGSSEMGYQLPEHNERSLAYPGGCWIPPQNLLGCQLGIADCHSISGFVARLGWGAVTWLSKCQMLVAQLSMEAEYIVVPHTTWEICWLRSFLAELRA